MLDCVLDCPNEVFDDQQGTSTAETSAPPPDTRSAVSGDSSVHQSPSNVLFQRLASLETPERINASSTPSSQSPDPSSRSPTASSRSPDRSASNSAATITLPSTSTGVPLAGVSSTRPRPKRLRPSEMSNVAMYQDTIRISKPAMEIPLSSRNARNASERNTSSARNTSSSDPDRWSITKNVRNLTTGCLDLGDLPIHVSPDLVDRFMEISSENSINKIETGGLLAGIIEDSVHFKVTTLVIPKQNGRSDYWEAINEAEIQTYFSNNGLLLLGCIHTHPPPWTSFLSSVDLHQLFDFQKDNPSAVSIVIAPAHMPTNIPAYGYSLTDMGLTVLADCRKKGVHQHRYNILLSCFSSIIFILFQGTEAEMVMSCIRLLHILPGFLIYLSA